MLRAGVDHKIKAMSINLALHEQITQFSFKGESSLLQERQVSLLVNRFLPNYEFRSDAVCFG